MPRRAAPLTRLLPVLAVLMTPVAGVMVVLVATGALGVLPALLAALAIALLTALLMRPYYADAADVIAYLRDMALGTDPTPPALRRSGPTEDIAAVVGQLRRASQQKRAELEALVASNEVLLDSLPDPLFMLNDQRRIVRANLAARRLFGRELAARDLAAVLREPSVLDAVDKVLAGGGGREVEFALPVPIERNFRSRVQRLPSKAVDGTVALMALHDLTAIKRIEQMRADFVANASHELRTPLATLLGFIETLRGPARDDAEARDRFLAIMHEQGSRMARLVADLLSLSRIELNEHTQPSERIEIGPILRGVAEPLEMLAASRGMTIAIDLPDDLPAVVGQADELTQVFQNLIDNALKYGRDSTPVEVTARLADTLPASAGAGLKRGAVAVTVRDHGEGIAREHLPRLTERFFRIDTARSRKMGGTGLGLAIVKHVLNRHRGALVIDSALGDGSAFTVYLPVAEVQATAAM